MPSKELIYLAIGQLLNKRTMDGHLSFNVHEENESRLHAEAERKRAGWWRWMHRGSPEGLERVVASRAETALSGPADRLCLFCPLFLKQFFLEARFKTQLING